VSNQLGSRLIILILSLSLGFAVSGCAKPNYSADGKDSTFSSKPGLGRCTAESAAGSLCIKVTWDILPTETQFGSFVFTLADLATDRLDSRDHSPMSVVLWMPSMGHGSSPITVEKIAPGIYRAKKVFFNMKGDWEVQFNIGKYQAVYALEI
jgi:hypothetical protein